MLKKCSCKHEFQDKQYGDSVRVYNPCKNDTHARCTVCSKEIKLKDDK